MNTGGEDKSAELEDALMELDTRMAELDEARNEVNRLKILHDQEKAASGKTKRSNF